MHMYKKAERSSTSQRPVDKNCRRRCSKTYSGLDCRISFLMFQWYCKQEWIAACPRTSRHRCSFFWRAVLPLTPFSPNHNSRPTWWEYIASLTASIQFYVDNLEDHPPAKPLPAFGDRKLRSASELIFACRREWLCQQECLTESAFRRINLPPSQYQGNNCGRKSRCVRLYISSTSRKNTSPKV